MNKPTLSVDEVAELLGLSRASCYAAIHRGEIPGVIRFGRRIVVSRRAIERLVDGELAQRQPAAAEA